MSHFDQIQFFQLIKEKLPRHISLAAFVSELFNISQNSAYRRINGESKLTADELYALITATGIDVARSFAAKNNRILFDYEGTDFEAMHLRNSLYQIMQATRVEQGASMWQASTDLSLLQLMQLPEIASFKLFYLLKTSYASKQLEKIKFSHERVAERHQINIPIIDSIVANYLRINEVAVISYQALNYLLDQIEYYTTAGYFQDKKDVVVLFEKIEELLHHLYAQAKSSKKFSIGSLPTTESGSFHLYVNRLMNFSSSILVQTPAENHAIIIINGLNYLHTTHNNFYAIQHKWIENLKKKSTSISTGSELDQEQFIRHFEDIIYTRKKKLGI